MRLEQGLAGLDAVTSSWPFDEPSPRAFGAISSGSRPVPWIMILDDSGPMEMALGRWVIPEVGR